MPVSRVFEQEIGLAKTVEIGWGSEWLMHGFPADEPVPDLARLREQLAAFSPRIVQALAALSLDEVGGMTSFRLRSPVAASRRGAERVLLRAARRAGVRMDWQRDADTGNSDHREFELAGMRALKLGTLDNSCRHMACDRPSRLRRGAFRDVVPVLVRALAR